jgi:hypothetical protein
MCYLSAPPANSSGMVRHIVPAGGSDVEAVADDRLLDECEGPPNFLELRDTSNKGLNVNGSVCLNYQCMYVAKVARMLDEN